MIATRFIHSADSWSPGFISSFDIRAWDLHLERLGYFALDPDTKPG
jgi:hypothetical protein